MAEKKTVLGISENFEALLCYAGFWITGFLFLILEKENQFVRFHALQSLVLFLGLFILHVVFSAIPILGWLLTTLLFPVTVIIWLLLMLLVLSGTKFKIPIIGDFVEEQLK